MRTKAGFGIIVLGVVIFIAALVSLISGLTHSQVEATVTAPEGSAYVVTDAGVLDLVNVKAHVTVQTAQKDSPVSLSVGTSEDVQAWSKGLAVYEVTGLKDWQHFAGKARAAEVEETPGVAGSDLWLHEENGKGKISFDYKVTEPGNTSLIAHAEDSSPLTLTISWKRPGILVNTLPVIVMGALIIAIGIILSLIGLKMGETGVWQELKNRSEKRKAKKRKQKPIDISDLDISVPSREELVEQDRDQQRHNTGDALGAGVIPLIDEGLREDTAELPRRRRSRVNKNNGKGDDGEA